MRISREQFVRDSSLAAAVLGLPIGRPRPGFRANERSASA